MKLRIMGSPDLVELWAARFAQVGIVGRTYPSRYGDDQLRWYGELDDRMAESLARAGFQADDKIVEPQSSIARVRRLGRRRRKIE